MLRRTLLIAALAIAVRAEAVPQVSNLAESLGFEMTANGIHFAAASSFTTGASATQLVSITVSVFTNTTGTSELRLRANNAGVPGALIESLGSQTLPSNQGNVLKTFNSVSTPTLSANTTYWVTLGETGSGNFQWDGTFSTAESSPAAWTIGNQAKSSGNGGATWGDVFGATQESGKFSVDADAISTNPDLAVTDEQNRAIYGVESATGDRNILSGCSDAGCSSQVGSGLPFQHPLGMVRQADGSLVVCDGPSGKSLFRVDPANGDRTVLSGCANAGCSSIVGTGINLVLPAGVLIAGSSFIVTDYRNGAFQGTVLNVDSVTGNRTTLSGCANDACSSSVGAGRAIKGPVGAIRTGAGQLYVVDRGVPPSSPGPAAVIAIDTANGNRAVISGCVDTSCTSTAGSGPPLSIPGPGAVAADGSLLIVDSSLNAVLRIDPATGNRTVISGCTSAGPCGGPPVGSGPALNYPILLTRAANGDLLVTDSGQLGVMRVHPTTGDRTVVTSTTVGAGPAFAAPVAVVELPEPGVAAGLVASAAMLALLAIRRGTPV